MTNMGKYIDTDKLIAEIEKRINWQRTCIKNEYRLSGKAEEEIIFEYEQLLKFITSLQQEQPEVDLDDVIENYILENFGERWDGCVPVGCFELNLMATHFYELGLSTMRKRLADPEYNQEIIEKMKSEYPADESDAKKEE